MRPSQLFAAVVALSSVSTAFSDVSLHGNALAEVKNMLLGRQDSSSASADASSTDKPQSTDSAKSTDKGSATTTIDGGKSTDKASASASASGSGSGNKSGSKTSSKPTPTEFGNDVQPGGVNMITPSAIAGPQYYKIGGGNYITFVWNYTSVSVSPTAVDVLATCTKNQATYTIAVNQTVQATQTVIWNASDYSNQYPNSPPLLTENYNLMIYDSNSTVSAAPKPGYLSPYTLLTFGMYIPRAAVPWENFTCAGCNSAMGATEHLTFKVMLITSATTIGSFLYFTSSFGLW